MELTKEKNIHKKYKTIRVIIRTNCYTSTFSHFLMLKSVLDKDFPDVDIDPEIIQYGGRHYKRTFGLEFTLPQGSSVPQEYDEVGQLEYKL